jgi:hypothetical protein
MTRVALGNGWENSRRLEAELLLIVAQTVGNGASEKPMSEWRTTFTVRNLHCNASIQRIDDELFVLN